MKDKKPVVVTTAIFVALLFLSSTTSDSYQCKPSSPRVWAPQPIRAAQPQPKHVTPAPQKRRDTKSQERSKKLVRGVAKRRSDQPRKTATQKRQTYIQKLQENQKKITAEIVEKNKQLSKLTGKPREACERKIKFLETRKQRIEDRIERIKAKTTK